MNESCEDVSGSCLRINPTESGKQSTNTSHSATELPVLRQLKGNIIQMQMWPIYWGANARIEILMCVGLVGVHPYKQRQGQGHSPRRSGTHSSESTFSGFRQVRIRSLHYMIGSFIKHQKCKSLISHWVNVQHLHRTFLLKLTAWCTGGNSGFSVLPKVT